MTSTSTSLNKLKRLQSQEDADISPPPLKRKPLSSPPSNPQATARRTQAHDPNNPNHLRIYSWNINGINPLLPNHTINQKSITSFFSPGSSPSKSQSSQSSSSQPQQPRYSLRLILHRLHYPQFLCLQEVKISPTDTLTQRAVEKAANDIDSIPFSSSSSPPPQNHTYTSFLCLPRDKHNARSGGGKIYGVCTLVRNDFLSAYVERTREVEWDVEGRVLITELNSLPRDLPNTKSEGKKIAIINGYWPNGTTNPYRSSSTGLVVGTRHDRKRAFQRLMLDEVLRYEKEGWQVVLVGDMNIAQSAIDGWPGIRLGAEHVRNRKEFGELFIGDGSMRKGGGEEHRGGDGGEREERKCMRGVDVVRWMHGREARKYTYYGRGVEWGASCDRVDLVIVSRGLVYGDGDDGENDIEQIGRISAVIDADTLETPEARGHSDHVPLYVVLDLRKLGIKGKDIAEN